MIDNEHVRELDIEFDTEYLRQLVLAKKGNNSSALLPHQNKAEEDQYLSSIRKKYPFLSSLYNIYIVQPGHDIPLHIDAKRDCAINIPLQGTEGSDTIFYRRKTKQETSYVGEKVWHALSEDSVIETFRFTLTRPTLVNNSAAPHKVEHRGSDTRIIISWSVNKGTMFEDVKRILENQTA
jgi:hypothetical protein